MNLVAEVPKFLVDSDYQALVIDGDRDRLTIVTLDDVSSNEEYNGDEAREAETADVQDQIEAVYEQAAIAISTSSNLNKVVKDCSRPMLTRAQVGRFLEKEGRKAHVLHDVGRVLDDIASRQVIQDAEAMASLSEAERDERRKLIDSEERERFWKLMGEVSAVSMKTAPYQIYCEEL